MLKIYGFARVNKMARGNTRDLRVLWATEEMGLPYEIVGMDHPNHDLDSPAYRAINPFGQIPAIEDDGVVVTESGAILLYFARKSGKLLPSDLAGEAQVLRWSVAALSTVELPVLSLWFVNLNAGKGTKPSAALRGWAEMRLEQLDGWLAKAFGVVVAKTLLQASETARPPNTCRCSSSPPQARTRRRPAKVPPLSCGRISKPRAGREPRPSPWYVTTGERHDS
jgi:glutathione S-transferase